MTGIGMSPDTACVEKFVGITKDHGNNRWLMSALPPKPESRHLDMFDVRFAPESGQIADISECPLCAMSDRTHCSKSHFYSITSSARASTVPGIVRPSAFA